MARILAVDDRPINLQFLVSLLGYDGHSVLEASDGQEALDITRDQHPDLVIADIEMPAMDGYEFVTRLRNEPRIAGTPVIFYTAHAGEAKFAARSRGVTQVLTKPAEPELILNTVSSALGEVSFTDRQMQSAGTAADVEFSTKIPDELIALQAVSLRLSALIELGLELASERDPQCQLDRFCSSARSIIGSSYAALGILDEKKQSIRTFVVSTLDPEKKANHSTPPAYHGVLGTVLTERRPLRLRKPFSEFGVMDLSPDGAPISSFLCVPLLSPTDVYGWLYLLDKLGAEEFSAEDERLAGTLAAQVALAYENVMLYETATRTAEELDKHRRQQLEMKDQFVSHVSHELRSPLAIIHQFVTLMLDGLVGEITAEQRENLDVVLKNTLQLREMISDLLDITGAEAGKLLFEQHAVSLLPLFIELETNYRERAAQKGILFLVREPRGLPLVHADPQRLRQVLSNLIDNALKFTERGKVTIRASIDDEPGFMRITVSDTGCGISERSLPLVFNRLYQEATTIEFSRKGLGLGLHICKQLIALHGGRIWVERRKDQGSTFVFTIPLRIEETIN
jgi:signal transduction histidine kinase/DNA-binding NarL/FixJ family response regulator